VKGVNNAGPALGDCQIEHCTSLIFEESTAISTLWAIYFSLMAAAESLIENYESEQK